MRFDVFPIRGFIENAFLIKGERIALVDTVAPQNWGKLLRVFADSNASIGEIECILITHHHFDHCGNLARLKELTGATIIASEADAPVIEGTTPNPPPSDLNRLGRFLGKLPGAVLSSYQKYDHVAVDRTVRGGETIEELGLEVIALPGHTAGGIGFYDKEVGRAFVGDIVSNYFSHPGMPTISASESIEDIFESQLLLAGLDLDTAYLGHGPVIQPDASKVIRELVERKNAAAGI